MVTVSETIEIDADPERVFDYLDDPHNHAEVTPSLSDIRNVESLEDGSKRLEFTYGMAGVGLDGELVQTIHQPPERHTFAMSGTLEGEIDIELEEHDDGTRLTYTGTYDLPGRVLSKAAEPFVRRYNERELRTTLENVRTRLELSA
ncbi:SRPBCC family protein [Natronococcus sp. A-GB1]|uniref:SRPBCC family protein n=1 Tax=unclassified Natronococcus TaxID=2623058 RepID=UPI00241E2E8B|nr:MULTISPECIES: SRPBCC family protein [unclassified Natronococcus]MDG5759291.1 SRPBCC family protein [Natronococcus sp. A-GB1]